MIQKKHTIFVVVIVFILSLSIFWISTNPLPSGYADSDEIITMGHLFSVAHPPGYGLNVVLVGLFQRLLFWLSPAYASNLFAGLLGALTLSALFLAVYNLVRYLNPSLKLDLWSQAGIALGILIIGLSGLFWQYSAIIEVMSLGNFFVSLILYLTTKCMVDNFKSTKSIYLTALIFGIGVSHLQSLILLGPGLLYLFITQLLKLKMPMNRIIKSATIILSLSLASFLITSAIIIPLNARQAQFSWDFQPTLDGWWKMIKRQDYQGFFADKGLNIQNSYISAINLDRLRAIPIYLVTLWNQFAGPSIIFTLIGVFYLFKKNKSIAIGFSIIYLISGLLFGSYVTLINPTEELLNYRLSAGVSHRQYLLGITVLGIFSGIGGFYLLEFIKNIFKSKQYKYLAMVLIIILPLTTLILANHTAGYQRNNSFMYRYNHSLLTSADPQSVIICTSDIACFGLYYQSLVENIRPDVTILSKITKARHYFLTQNNNYIGFEYGDNPFFFAQEIGWNVAHRPTYVTSLDSFYVNYLGLDGQAFYLVPTGYLFKIQSDFPQHLVAIDEDPLINEYLTSPADSRDLYYLGFADYFANNFQVRAQLFTKYRDKISAINALNYAITLNNHDQRILDWLSNIDIYIDASSYMHIPELPPHNYLIEADSLFKQGEIDKAYEAARIASYQNPLSPDPLILLKSIYIAGGYQDYAYLTQKHIEALGQLP